MMYIWFSCTLRTSHKHTPLSPGDSPPSHFSQVRALPAYWANYNCSEGHLGLWRTQRERREREACVMYCSVANSCPRSLPLKFHFLSDPFFFCKHNFPLTWRRYVCACACECWCVFSRSHSSALVFVCNRFVTVIEYLCVSNMCEGIKYGQREREGGK